jgi:hypothetical protein
VRWASRSSSCGARGVGAVSTERMKGKTQRLGLRPAPNTCYPPHWMPGWRTACAGKKGAGHLLPKLPSCNAA